MGEALKNSSARSAPKAWYHRIGPGLITACVVIGPGSIMTSSSVGANDSYAMLWVVAVSVVFMLVYMTLGAKLGVATTQSPCDLIRKKAGPWLSILVGIGVFFISAAFQSGNNIGVAAAFEAFIESKTIVAVLVVAFNGLAILFLFAFKEMYKMLERLMMAFVATMLICFAINLLMLGPNLVDMASGLVPSLGRSRDLLSLLGLVGTTFVITAAFYQSYLVKQKGWSSEDIKSGLIDARVGSAIMFLITLMLMSTAAAGLYTGQPVTLDNPVSVATSLETTFGSAAKIIFCVGLFSAAYSSFLVNSMIGGFMAADALGLGSKPTDLAPRLLTTAALLSGMSVGLAVLVYDFDRTPTIIAAQAVTVVAAPLIAGVLLWLTSSRDVMGEHANGPITKTFAGIGLVLLIAMAGRTAFDTLPQSIEKYRDRQATATADFSLTNDLSPLTRTISDDVPFTNDRFDAALVERKTTTGMP
ncbi:MAG: divalent metal cation transporter [Phycisphaera sp. RhM]|nr:divalent metal cation transporter [Phycisphaera sp. RhM]